MPENLTKMLKIRWPSVGHMSTPKIAGIHIRRKIISRLPACSLTITLHYMYFHYDSCANLVSQVYQSLVVNHSIINIHSCILTGVLPHSADLRH